MNMRVLVSIMLFFKNTLNAQKLRDTKARALAYMHFENMMTARATNMT